MFSVYLNWIDNGIQTDTVLEYLQEFKISSLIIFLHDIVLSEWRQSGNQAPTVVSGLNPRKWSHKMCFTKPSPARSPARSDLELEK